MLLSYGRNKIYFSLTVCQLADRLGNLAYFLSSNYQNVALKDEKGNLYVSSEVKQVWDKAVETIPKLLSLLEAEFRDILGVKSQRSAPADCVERGG